MSKNLNNYPEVGRYIKYLWEVKMFFANKNKQPVDYDAVLAEIIEDCMSRIRSRKDQLFNSIFCTSTSLSIWNDIASTEEFLSPIDALILNFENYLNERVSYIEGTDGNVLTSCVSFDNTE